MKFYKLFSLDESKKRVIPEDTRLTEDGWFTAMRDHDAEMLEFYIQHGWRTIDATDFRGNTALIEMCKTGKLDIVKLLVSKDADINHLNHNNWSPLMMALHYTSLNIARYLIYLGAKVDNPIGNRPNLRVTSGGYLSPASIVSQYSGEETRREILKLLYEKGAEFKWAISYLKDIGKDGLSQWLADYQKELDTYYSNIESEI